MPRSQNAKALFLEVMSMWVCVVFSFRLTEKCLPLEASSLSRKT